MHGTRSNTTPWLALPGASGEDAHVAALELLTDAAVFLPRSLDIRNTLSRAVAVMVPALADWCVLYTLEPGARLARREGAAASRRGEVLARDAIARAAVEPDPEGAIARVVRTGLSEVLLHDRAMLESSIAMLDPALTALAGECGASATLVLPLAAKGRALGAMVLALATDARRYEPPSVRLAERLAHLVALALGNALEHERLLAERSERRGTRQGSLEELVLLRAAAPSTPGERVAPPPGARGSRTILLVDDEPELRAVARRILELHGYRVLEAEDANEALAVAVRHGAAIDLVLADLLLPGMDGRECVERLRALRSDLKAVYMSGCGAHEASRRGVDPRRDPFLAKPFDAETLADTVRSVMGELARN
ncbi:MAG TPA: response regulator [Gemmatimonadaceae bacterium]